MEGRKNSQKQLSQESVNEIIDQINKTKIMEKNCKPGGVLDYGATYRFNIEGKIKSIDYPGCGDELRKIDDFIKTSLK